MQDAAYGAYGHQNFADHSAQPSPKLYDPSTGRLALSTDTSYGPSAGYEAKQTSYPQYNLQNTSILYYTDRQESTLLSPQSVREKPPLPSRSAEASEPTGRRAVSQQLYSRPPYQNTSDSYHTDMPGYSSTSRSIPHSASTSSIPVYETTRQGLRRRFPTVSSSYAPHDSVGPTLNSSYGAFNGPGRNVAVSPEQSPPSPHLLASRKIVTLPLIRHYCLREILGPNTPNHKACLDIRGDLPSMTSNWTPAEWKMKRRVVQFRRAQLGTTITAQFEGVAPEARSPKAGCISCIWWEAKGEYCATSADIIALFGFLVGMRRVDKKEQNRIRRNIETFGAITTGLINTEDMTTSKPRSQSCEDLFQLIMSFEHPKPRQIKKALKVFQWKHLDHMLRKVMDKYVSD